MMYKSDKHKQRVLRAANSKPVKEDVFLWLKIITGLCLLVIGSLTLTPVIADYVDTWHPFTQLGVTLLIFISVSIYIKLKTK